MHGYTVIIDYYYSNPDVMMEVYYKHDAGPLFFFIYLVLSLIHI